VIFKAFLYGLEFYQMKWNKFKAYQLLRLLIDN
jgi:hypothetical protein